MHHRAGVYTVVPVCLFPTGIMTRLEIIIVLFENKPLGTIHVHVGRAEDVITQNETKDITENMSVRLRCLAASVPGSGV